MKREVVLSPIGKKKLEQLLNYLQENFSEKTKRDFISKVEYYLERIDKYPESFPASKANKTVRRCGLSKTTIMFYRIRKSKIEILTFFDSRQHPDSSPY